MANSFHKILKVERLDFLVAFAASSSPKREHVVEILATGCCSLLQFLLEVSRVERVVKVETEGVVNEVLGRGRHKRHRAHFNVVLVLAQVPIAVNFVITDRFLAEKHAEEDHTEAPYVHGTRMLLELLEETFWGNERRIETLVRENLVTVRLSRGGEGTCATARIKRRALIVC